MVKILVVSRADLFGKDDERAFGGFLPPGKINFEDHIKNFLWLERSDAEEDPAYKQVVPYVAIYNTKLEKFFVYKRTTKGGESRLHLRRSIGIGGHIEEQDLGTSNIMETAMLRELAEEVTVQHRNARLIGFINDDSDLVGQVHFGFCYIIETDSEIEINEPELEGGQWMSIEEMENASENFEKWSRIFFEYLKENIPKNHKF